LSLIWNLFIVNLPSHRQKGGNGDRGTWRVANEYNNLETVMSTSGTWTRKTNQITGNKSSKSQSGKRSQVVGNKRDEKTNVRTVFVAVQVYPISLSGSNTYQERGLNTMKTKLRPQGSIISTGLKKTHEIYLEPLCPNLLHFSL
jgi:hypothetical protein